jgi:hypothetical protein
MKQNCYPPDWDIWSLYRQKVNKEETVYIKDKIVDRTLGRKSSMMQYCPSHVSLLKQTYVETLDNTEHNAMSFTTNVGKLLPRELNEFIAPQRNLIYTNIHRRINPSCTELLKRLLETKITALS